MRKRPVTSGDIPLAACAVLVLVGLLPLYDARGVAKTTPSSLTCSAPSSAGAIVRRTRLSSNGGVQQQVSIVVDAAHGRLYDMGETPDATTTMVSEIDICTGAILAQRRFAGYAGPIALDPAANIAAVVIEGDSHSILQLLDATTLVPEHTIGLPAAIAPGFVLAIDPADRRVAVSNGGKGLLLIDEQTGRRVRYLPLRFLINGAPFNGFVRGIAVDERRHRLAFVADNQEGAIIAAASGSILHSFLISGLPDGIAMDPVRGQTIVIYSGDATHPNRIVFLNTQSGRLLRRFVLPGDPSDLALDPATGHIFVPLRLPNDDQGLAMIDAATHTLRRTLTLARANGSYIHFGAGQMAIDTTRHHLFLGVEGPTSWSTGKFIGPGRLFTIDTRTGRIIASRRVGQAPDLLALDTPAQRIVLGDTADNSLTYLLPSRLSAVTPPTIITGPAPPLCHPYTAQLRFVDRGQIRPLTYAERHPKRPQRTGPYLGIIAPGPDRALWFTTTKAAVGRITTAGQISLYALPPALTSLGWLLAGRHGALWFTLSHGLGYIDARHHVVTARFPPYDHSQLQALALGADGSIWFDETGSGPGDRVGRVSLRGAVQTFCLPSQDAAPRGITMGPDGNVWVAESGKDSIARVAPGGQITEFPLGSIDGSQPGFLVHYVEYIAPARGALWFTEFARRLGRITTSGHVTIFHLSQSIFNQGIPLVITPGPDGSLWFSELYGNDIGRIASDGLITEFPLPTPNAGPLGITAGPDGALWITEMCANAVARVTATGQVTEYPVSATEHGNGAYCVESP